MQPISPQVAQRLLRHLSHDEAFRANLLKNPHSALSAIGIELDADQVAANRVLAAPSTFETERRLLLSPDEDEPFMLPFFVIPPG